MTYLFILKISFVFFLISGIILFFYGLREAFHFHEYYFLLLAFIAFLGAGTIAAIINFNIYC